MISKFTWLNNSFISFRFPSTVLNCILSVSLIVTNLHVKFYATWNDIQVYQLNQRLLSTMRGTKKVKAKWLSSRLSFWHWQLGSSPFRNIHSNFEIYQNLSCLRRNVTKMPPKIKRRKLSLNPCHNISSRNLW